MTERREECKQEKQMKKGKWEEAVQCVDKQWVLLQLPLYECKGTEKHKDGGMERKSGGDPSGNY